MIAEIADHAALAPPDQARRLVRRGGIEQVDFRRVGMVVGIDQDKAAAFGLADPEKKSWIVFLMQNPVARRVGADAMEADAVRAVIVVQRRIDQALPVGREGEVALGIAELFGQQLTGLQIAQLDRAVFRTVAIDRGGVEPVVRRMRCAADGKEFFAPGSYHGDAGTGSDIAPRRRSAGNIPTFRRARAPWNRLA